MYIVFTDDHDTCAVTRDADTAVRFAFNLIGKGIVAKIRRLETDA